MTIRRRILIVYSLTLLGALAIVGFWSWFEFDEQRTIALQGDAESMRNSSPLLESLEILILGGVPAALLGLLAGRWMIQRALSPIGELTEVLENTTTSNLSEAVPQSGNGDELDRMTAVFNGMKVRLGVSFTQAREFTLHASHELKTPLTIMHGTLEQMLEDPVTPEGHRDKVASMLEEVQRLSAIVGQLSFLAKADAGLLDVEYEPVALDALVKDVAEDAVMLAAPAGITVVLDDCTSATTIGDRKRLRQVLLNLADNAVKHNRAGGSVHLSLRDQNDVIEYQIVNTGEPLQPEFRHRAFERFFRGDAAHNPEVEGSGLGLSIAQSIARAHQGEIVMSVLEDQRTCVTLRLPSATASATHAKLN